MKVLLSGDEAVARGLYEAGVALRQPILVRRVRKFWKMSQPMMTSIRNGRPMKKLPSKRPVGHLLPVSAPLQP